MSDLKYTQDGLPVVSKETYEAFLHDIREIPLTKMNSLLLDYADELDKENPYLSKLVSMFTNISSNDPKTNRAVLETVTITYKLMKSQMQNNKISEMLADNS